MTGSPRHPALPGLSIALGIAAGAWVLVQLIAMLPPPFGALPVSMMLVSILAGLALAGPAARHENWEPGLNLARGPILKIAVALIGLRLSLTDLGQLGLQALPLVAVVVVFGLVLTLILARSFGASGRLAALLAVGTAICGASAIAATAPGLRARSDEVCYAIACIAVIGLGATLIYPAGLGLLFDTSQDIGLVMGVAIHDTAQVTAAALMHEQVWETEGTLLAATVAKLLRNSAMLVVIPALVWFSMRNQSGETARAPFPFFIVAFVLLSGVRSLGDAWLGANHDIWQALIDLSAQASVFAFAMAMAALAMAVRPSELRSLGWKPAAAALISAGAILALAVAWVGSGTA